MDKKAQNEELFLLQGRIMEHIRLAEKRRRKIAVSFSAAFSAVSFSAMIATSIWLYRDLVQSGFLDTASLLFSDSGTVFAYWHDFFASLLEFLPFASLTACLSSIAVSLTSLSFLSKHAGRAISTSQSAGYQLAGN